MIIRPALPADAQSIFDLTRGLIEDHAPGFNAPVTVDDVRNAGFGDDPLFEAIVAERNDGSIVGCVSFFRGYAGWHGKPVAFVHLLFVRDDARKQGVARKLMAAVAAVAIARGWVRIDLYVADGRPAISFYRAIGMKDEGHKHYQINGIAMKVLAEDCPLTHH